MFEEAKYEAIWGGNEGVHWGTKASEGVADICAFFLGLQLFGAAVGLNSNPEVLKTAGLFATSIGISKGAKKLREYFNERAEAMPLPKSTHHDSYLKELGSGLASMGSSMVGIVGGFIGSTALALAISFHAHVLLDKLPVEIPENEQAIELNIQSEEITAE